ncbi:MmcQ/YjbR family DNA-binding protein [Gulosibacter molinativorax]|uniref:MmcQ/YjbR family DNA-binding protein n=1 Tax=Gulosibacter molinativorax TaxID=256821 RepID=A0ABT7C5P5_9MICO|nr:MmcQ/YjbR family DNA-binding protein [Gulosibacter molinativorax]MDJ1370521.1 MmcQ/YjbR family DNA-binding protein [Gulosibacter molinativorax]QUY62067.1 Hypotetical protein [Gulosibacter molinativorax]
MEIDVREIALAFDGAVEQPHHGFPSFRVKNRIFATLPEPDTLRIMLDEFGIRTAVLEYPEFCSELYWGRRLACVEIDVSVAEEIVVRGLLEDAWALKAA